MAKRGETRRYRPVRTPTRQARRATPKGISWKARDRVAREEWERELGAAADVQACLLPSKIPQIPGYDVYAYYRSAKEVGGDYYDFFPIDAQRLGIVIADVSGKGIPGAMVMASTRALLRVLAPQCGSAAETMSRVNMYVARDVKRGMFVTAVFGILDVRAHELTVCSAGHNPMVVFREGSGRCGLLNPGGIALGFDRGPVFDRTLNESKLTLKPGDRFVLYTDGVVEAMNSRHEQYGEERFYHFVLQNARLPSRDFVRSLARELDEFKGEAEQHDDITVSTVRLLVG